MRVLHLVSGSKWTGPAAVAVDQVRALRAAGIEAEIGFTAPGGLASRFAADGWARPLLTKPRRPGHFAADLRRVRDTLAREHFDILHAHHSHDHMVAAVAARGGVSGCVAASQRPTPATKTMNTATPARIARSASHWLPNSGR